MIVQMNTLTLLCVAHDRAATLEALRDLGVLHVKPVVPPASSGLEQARTVVAADRAGPHHRDFHGRLPCGPCAHGNGAQTRRAARRRPVHAALRGGAYFSLASARSASALSVFSHENDVAVTCLPAALV